MTDRGYARIEVLNGPEGIAAVFPYQLGKGIGGKRAADEVALDDVAAVLTKECQLFVILHAFGNDAKFEAVGQRDDGAADGDVVFVVGYAVDEGFVEFQGIDGKTLEVAEGR